MFYYREEIVRMGHILDWRTFMQDNIFYRITVGWVRFD
ncbi:hypothetical protein YPPY54_3782, partial [Yersinia pestis PY-54]